MTSNNKKINALREGIGRLTDALDERWSIIKSLPRCCAEVDTTYYSGLTKTIELLGGDWQRDENGKHKIFIAGVTCEVDNED